MQAQSYWVIIPAAGSGNRFSHNLPKQYCELRGKTVIEHTLNVFLKNKQVKQVVVALSAEDTVFSKLPIADHARVTTVQGGATRMQSVLNALNWIKTVGQTQDWVMVHDAVRPALHAEDLENLMLTVGEDEVGGILASPVQDTIKFSTQSNRIAHTVSRNALWQALTPQLFRMNVLLEGLNRCEAIGFVATDEAQAVEQFGHKPKIVKSKHPNPKLTFPQDIHFLTHLLSEEEAASCV